MSQGSLIVNYPMVGSSYQEYSLSLRDLVYQRTAIYLVTPSNTVS